MPDITEPCISQTVEDMYRSLYRVIETSRPWLIKEKGKLQIQISKTGFEWQCVREALKDQGDTNQRWD